MKKGEIARKTWESILKSEENELDIIKKYIKDYVKENVIHVFKNQEAFAGDIRSTLFSIPIGTYNFISFIKAIKEFGYCIAYLESEIINIYFPEKGSNTEAGILATELEKEIELYYKSQNKLAKEAVDQFLTIVNNGKYNDKALYNDQYEIEYVQISVLMPIEEISPQFKYEAERLLLENKFSCLAIFTENEQESWWHATISRKDFE